MSVSIDHSVRVPEGVVFRELDGETVILNLESGTYFGLDPIGTRIWQLCQERGSLRSVLAAMLEEFDASADVIQSDILALVDELSAQGLIALQ
jgi:hypothetical protein